MNAYSYLVPGMIVSSGLEFVSLIEISHAETILAANLARYGSCDTVLTTTVADIPVADISIV